MQKLIDSRIKILKGRGHCFNCLRKSHRSQDCTKYPECKGKHHPSICKKENEEVKKEGHTTFKSTLNPEAPPFSSIVPPESNHVYLIKVLVFNPITPQLCEDVKVILDSDSQ